MGGGRVVMTPASGAGDRRFESYPPSQNWYGVGSNPSPAARLFVSNRFSLEEEIVFFSSALRQKVTVTLKPPHKIRNEL